MPPSAVFRPVGPDVLVVGAGVIGLTTGICLAEAGLEVIVAAAEPPQLTTSAAAGALWGPHLVGRDDRIARWAAVTLERLAELTAPGLGANALDGIVRTVAGIAASGAGSAGPPEFAADPSRLTECAPNEVPAGYQTAWRMTAPIIAMPGYLDYLRDRFLRAGGTTTFPATFASLADASRRHPSARVIVNCTGCGSCDLVPDPAVIPVRGQVVVVSNPGIGEWFVGTGAEHWELTYLFPHGDIVVLGGTEEAGDWNREPYPATAEQIIASCAKVQPALRGATVLGHRVGLRPTRPRVRLEAEPLETEPLETEPAETEPAKTEPAKTEPAKARLAGGVTVVHNYGHGGAGVTLSWGCAEDAAEVAMAAIG